MKRVYTLLLILILVFCGCSDRPGPIEPDKSEQTQPDLPEKPAMVNPKANTLEERFLVPAGYERVAAGEHSFGRYLRTLTLKPDGVRVKYYNGETKNKDVYEAVVDLDIGSRDLQQCADAVIRLRAEYLFKEKRYRDIHFNFTSGFTAAYSKWRDGYRVTVQGNFAGWVKTAAYSAKYQDFRKYLDTVFAYAGTLSLAKELVPVMSEDMQIGDVFIQGGSPGHCVIVVDMAENPQTGEKIFMLAQSYMPAQDIQILKNPDHADISPWYPLNFGDVLNTPEWAFEKEDLKRFK
ncbi:MAG: DUF4846 domain-containing protein [Dehalobacterium sp.]